MDDLRTRIADELSGWPLGSGYYQTTVSPEEAAGMADAVITALGMREERRHGGTTTLNDSAWTWPDKRRWVTEWEKWA